MKRGLLLIVLCLAAKAGLRDPFPPGYGAGTLGTIHYGNSLAGRQPWVAAAWDGDSTRLACASSATWFYDPMNNLPDASLRLLSFGGRIRWPLFILKAAYHHFDALGIYREQEGYLSLGTDLFRLFRVSFQVSAFRVGLVDKPHTAYSLLYGGAALFVPLGPIGVSLERAQVHLARQVSANQAGIDPPETFRMGISSREHRFGSQGVIWQVRRPFKEWEMRVMTGLEYCLAPFLAFHVAVATNPFLVGTGIVLTPGKGSGYGSLVHHPELGWSKTVGLEWHAAPKKGRGSIPVVP